MWGTNVYKMIVCNLFCKCSINIFNERFGRNLFDEGIDCKAFLEEQHKLKL